jgi:hypothetical protein
MPPTPWQAEILAGSIWGGSCRSLAKIGYIAFDGKSSPDAAGAATSVNGSGDDNDR